MFEAKLNFYLILVGQLNFRYFQILLTKTRTIALLNIFYSILHIYCNMHLVNAFKQVQGTYFSSSLAHIVGQHNTKQYNIVSSVCVRIYVYVNVWK